MCFLKYGLCFCIFQSFIGASPRQQLTSNAELIGSLGTQCRAGNSFTVLPGRSSLFFFFFFFNDCIMSIVLACPHVVIFLKLVSRVCVLFFSF